MVISLPLKLQLAADKDGNPTLIAYPVQRELSVDRNNELRLSQQELDALRRGDVLQKAIDINGEKTQQYLQLDPETKSIIHRRITEVQICRLTCREILVLKVHFSTDSLACVFPVRGNDFLSVEPDARPLAVPLSGGGSGIVFRASVILELYQGARSLLYRRDRKSVV